MVEDGLVVVVRMLRMVHQGGGIAVRRMAEQIGVRFDVLRGDGERILRLGQQFLDAGFAMNLLVGCERTNRCLNRPQFLFGGQEPFDLFPLLVQRQVASFLDFDFVLQVFQLIEERDLRVGLHLHFDFATPLAKATRRDGFFEMQFAG